MVASTSSPKKPHLVSFYSNGKITCDCINYFTRNLCSHVIAVAELQSSLPQLLKWYKDTNKEVNLWNAARSSGVPKHPGEKLNGQKRKRSHKVVPPPESRSSLLPTPTKSPTSKTVMLVLHASCILIQQSTSKFHHPFPWQTLHVLIHSIQFYINLLFTFPQVVLAQLHIFILIYILLQCIIGARPLVHNNGIHRHTLLYPNVIGSLNDRVL